MSSTLQLHGGSDVMTDDLTLGNIVKQPLGTVPKDSEDIIGAHGHFFGLDQHKVLCACLGTHIQVVNKCTLSLYKQHIKFTVSTSVHTSEPKCREYSTHTHTLL